MVPHPAVATTSTHSFGSHKVENASDEPQRETQATREQPRDILTETEQTLQQERETDAADQLKQLERERRGRLEREIEHGRERERSLDDNDDPRWG